MKILIIGANGQVGSELMNIFKNTSHEVVGFTRHQLNCVNLYNMSSILTLVHPHIVINAAAYTAVDKAEEEVDLAFLVNKAFVSHLAYYCSENKIFLIHLSTDYVFDGTNPKSYCETDVPNPQGVYAQSKFEGEQAILAQLKEHIILRVSWVFGVHGTNFVKTILNLASSKEQIKIVGDQWGRPTSARDIARVILELVNKISYTPFNNWGIYHYAGEGSTNWYDIARVFIDLAKKQGLDPVLNSLINAINTSLLF